MSMMDFDGKEMQEEFNRVFGEYVRFNNGTPLDIDNLTVEQLWWLAKFAKHVRGRCRNNTAFNNYMNRNFSPAKFQSVQKEFSGRQYEGLKITLDDKSVEG